MLPSCLWSIGFSVFLAGNVLDFIALGLTKVSIVTLVGSGSLVVNTVMARLLLKEVVTTLDVLSSVLIVGGITLTVVGNQSGVKDWPLEDLIAQYKRTDVVVMLVLLSAIIVSCFLVMAGDTARRRYAHICFRVWDEQWGPARLEALRKQAGDSGPCRSRGASAYLIRVRQGATIQGRKTTGGTRMQGFSLGCGCRISSGMRHGWPPRAARKHLVYASALVPTRGRRVDVFMW